MRMCSTLSRSCPCCCPSTRRSRRRRGGRPKISRGDLIIVFFYSFFCLFVTFVIINVNDKKRLSTKDPDSRRASQTMLEVDHWSGRGRFASTLAIMMTIMVMMKVIMLMVNLIRLNRELHLILSNDDHDY